MTIATTAPLWFELRDYCASPAFDWDTFVVKSRYITQLRGRLSLEDEVRDICAIYDHDEANDE